MTMSIKYLITLAEEEQTLLQQIIKKNKSTALRTKRAFVLLACADISQTNHQISAAYHMSIRAIERLRKRFVEEGFALALEGKKWGGHKQKTFDGRTEAHVLALRCSPPPSGYTKWSLRLLADQLVALSYVEAISHTAVGKLLKKTKLSPGKSKVG